MNKDVASTVFDDPPLPQSQTSALHLESTSSLIGRSAASTSSGSLSITPAKYLRRTLTPRRSLTPREAVDTLQLRLTQANDIQHLLERELKEITNRSAVVQSNINNHFDQLIKQLVARKDSLIEQVDRWQKDKISEVQAEIQRASQYEVRCIKASEQCNQIANDESLDRVQKKIKISTIKSQVGSADGGYALNYGDSKHLADYINAMTTVLSVQYPKQVSMEKIDEYGQMVTTKATSRLSVPVLDLKAPMKGRESKSGYKMNLKWTVSQPLAAHNFIIRCLMKDAAKSNHSQDARNSVDDEKMNDQHGEKDKDNESQWKSLLFRMKDGNAKRTEFETKDIDSVFLFDKEYKFRIEYHISDPVNLLIGSNVQCFAVTDEPPQNTPMEQIELEYHSSKGNSYDGHPRGLLVGTRQEYRSEKNREFGYGERDWIIFKLKHSGVGRQYLPKMVVLKNGTGSQAVRDMIVSIGDLKVWQSFERIKLDKQGSEYQKRGLKGVDWKLMKQMKSQWLKLEFLDNFGECRGSQCRFKMMEFKLFGLEFK